MKANANGATFGIGDLAGSASIENDALHRVWFTLRCKATSLFDMSNAPRRGKRTRGVFVQSARRPAEKRQEVQIATPLSNDNASFARAQYDGSNGKETTR